MKNLPLCILLILTVVCPLTARAATEIGVPPAPVIPDKTFDITAYGAVGDGKTMNTGAFAKAIAACSQAGGGSVIVPEGVFLTGPITLVSHMALVVKKGGTIQASGKFSDFGLPDPLPTNQDQLTALRPMEHSLISGSELTDVAIRGEGTIDGAGAPWWARTIRPQYNLNNAPLVPRPNMIVIQKCERLEVSGVTLSNSPQFHLVPRECTDVLIDGVKITSPADAQNTDAIDPSNSKNVLIRHVYTSTGDDNVSFKGSGTIPTENVTVTDCTFNHGHGVSVGSNTDAGIRNILVQRCTFENTDTAIRIKSARGRGGVIEDITYQDITMKNVGRAVYINLFYEDKEGGSDPRPEPITKKTPFVRNILIKNITCDNAHYAGEITGLPESTATNIVLENVHVSAWSGFTIQDSTGLQFKNVSFITSPRPANADELLAADLSIPGFGTTYPSPSVAAAVREGKVTVAADGSGDFKAVQEAINAAPDGVHGGNPFVIHLKPGTYKEIVMVPKSKGPIDLEGQDAKTTTITNSNAASTLDKNGNHLGTFGSATVFIASTDFAASNVTFENSFGKGSQALAVNIGGDRDAFYKCRFLGFQDTILIREARQYFEDCTITGAVDFIFGASTAWFERCHIYCVDHGYITAANTPQEQPFGYVFDHCDITGAPGVVAYLGRPWRPYADVIYMNTDMSEVISPDGWHLWNKDDAGKPQTARYSEYKSTGAGGKPDARVPWSRQLTDADAAGITIDNVLGGWKPQTH